MKNGANYSEIPTKDRMTNTRGFHKKTSKTLVFGEVATDTTGVSPVM